MRLYPIPGARGVEDTAERLLAMRRSLNGYLVIAI